MKRILLCAVAMMIGITSLSVFAQEKSKVYYIKEITPENMMKLYRALGKEAKGKNVAVKLSTGEAGNPNYLQPTLIEPLVNEVKGTIVECNTAYNGKRNSVEAHMKVAEDHGFTKIANVDIMDSAGEVALPLSGGKHLQKDVVGKNFLNYDFLVVLSHFKGHGMAGFGGAMKNISIGIASRNGKTYIHSGGKKENADTDGLSPADHDTFQESMAEACKAILTHMNGNVLFINVANNLSVDCDCASNPKPAAMADLGMFASLDPVAVDMACIDAVKNSDDHGKVHLIERLESRHGMRQLEYAEQLGLGSRAYELIEIK